MFARHTEKIIWFRVRIQRFRVSSWRAGCLQILSCLVESLRAPNLKLVLVTYSLINSSDYTTTSIRRYYTLCFFFQSLTLKVYIVILNSGNHRMLGVFCTCMCERAHTHTHIPTYRHTDTRTHTRARAIIFIVNLTLNIRSCPILNLVRTLRSNRVIFSVKCAEEQSVYYNYGVYAWKRLLFIFTSDDT